MVVLRKIQQLIKNFGLRKILVNANEGICHVEALYRCFIMRGLYAKMWLPEEGLNFFWALQ